MRALIVAKTRRGSGACIGAIGEARESLRLEAVDAATNEAAGLEYEVGEVWEIEGRPAAGLISVRGGPVPEFRGVRVRVSERAQHLAPQEVRGHRLLQNGPGACLQGQPLHLFGQLTGVEDAGQVGLPL